MNKSYGPLPLHPTTSLYAALVVMAPRKRRHEQAFSDREEEVVPEEPDEETTEKARADKEQEVWDAIREAHYEGEHGSALN